MAIIPVSGVGIAPVTSAPKAAPAGGADFAKGLEQISKLTETADKLGAEVATGKLENLHDFTAASAKASLAMELTVAVRNRAVEAYQEIMRMQV